MGSVHRLVKVSTLARQPGPSRQSSGGSGGGSGAALSSSSKGKPSRGMLGRLSLGGSRKSVADVFAVEPSPRRQSLTRQSSSGSRGGFGSARSSFTYGAGAGGSVSSAAAGSDGRQGPAAAVASARAHGQREALFGQRGAAEGGGGRLEGGGVRGGVGGTHAAVSEARDLAIERGEKLENMVDRSRQLEDSAMAFGDMAKQLRRQQEDESCCVS